MQQFRFHRRLGPSCACVAMLVLGGGSLVAAASAATPVAMTLTGHVGSLRLNKSTSKQVHTFLKERSSNIGAVGSELNGSYYEIQYKCGKRCSTIGDFSLTKKFKPAKLEQLSTTSARFKGPFGVTIGMSTAQAEKRAGVTATTIHQFQCSDGINLGYDAELGTDTGIVNGHKYAAAAFLTISGGTAGPGGTVNGGRVSAIGLTTTRLGVGDLTGCGGDVPIGPGSGPA